MDAPCAWPYFVCRLKPEGLASGWHVRAYTVPGPCARPGRSLIAAITLPLAVFVAAGAFDFRAEAQQVRDQALATATALAEHAQTVVETTELVLARVLDRVAGMDWATIPSSPALHAFLLKLREDLPQIDSVFLVSPEGENVASTRSFPLADPFSTAERDFYKVARAGNFGPFVSTPFLGRSGQGLTFTLTQARVSNGAFDGLAGVTISPTYFQQFYAQAMDYPGESTDDAGAGGRHDPAPLSRKRHVTRPAVGQECVHARDGSERPRRRVRGPVYHRRAMAAGCLPAFAQPAALSSATRSTLEAYLAPWRRNLLLIGGFSAMLAISLLIVERVQQRRAERREAGGRGSAAGGGPAAQCGTGARADAEDGGARAAVRRRRARLQQPADRDPRPAGACDQTLDRPAGAPPADRRACRRRSAGPSSRRRCWPSRGKRESSGGDARPERRHPRARRHDRAHDRADDRADLRPRPGGHTDPGRNGPARDDAGQPVRERAGRDAGRAATAAADPGASMSPPGGAGPARRRLCRDRRLPTRAKA